ncbi:MAG: flagellar export chaperone FliS [Desulfobulbaceae bacterium]|jgi:flagellar protein FliS|nr:flagellar export chaperone FliS [Desulfobulbaceae bacterium]
MTEHSQYLRNQIFTATPEQLLIMLYDGAIRFTRQAISGVEETNLNMMSHGIRRAMAIITEFSNTLNHEVGGAIAENLDALYNFMVRELTLANLHRDAEKLRVVENLLVGLRATWAEAIQINRGATAQTLMPRQYAPLAIAG